MEQEKPCKVTAGHVAILEALAVVLGVIGILLGADATYEDYLFTRYVERGEVWIRDGKSTAMDKVRWIKDQVGEGGQLRGKLDWYFLCTLILITVTHIFLVLNLMHEISLARRENEATGGPGAGAKLSVTTTYTTTNTIIEPDISPAVPPTVTVVSAAPRKNPADAPASPSPSAGGQSSSIHEDSEVAVAEPTQAKPSKGSQTLRKYRRHRSRRRPEEYAKLFAISTAVISALTLLLISGLTVEIFLVKRLDDLYTRVGNFTETYPFPLICAIGRRKEFINYQKQGKGDPYRKGICNDWLTKLAAAAASIMIVLISITIAIFYGLRYRRIVIMQRAAAQEREGKPEMEAGGGEGASVEAERKASDKNNGNDDATKAPQEGDE